MRRGRQIELCIAPQNLVEFWVVATRPLENNGMGMSAPRIAAEVQAMRGIFRLLEGKTGVINAWEKLVGASLVSGKLAHDAHLAATMLVHGVTEILTFNATDFDQFPDIAVLDPTKV